MIKKCTSTCRSCAPTSNVRLYNILCFMQPSATAHRPGSHLHNSMLCYVVLRHHCKKINCSNQPPLYAGIKCCKRLRLLYSSNPFCSHKDLDAFVYNEMLACMLMRHGRSARVRLCTTMNCLRQGCAPALACKLGSSTWDTSSYTLLVVEYLVVLLSLRCNLSALSAK